MSFNQQLDHKEKTCHKWDLNSSGKDNFSSQPPKIEVQLTNWGFLMNALLYFLPLLLFEVILISHLKNIFFFDLWQKSRQTYCISVSSKQLHGWLSLMKSFMITLQEFNIVALGQRCTPHFASVRLWSKFYSVARWITTRCSHSWCLQLFRLSCKYYFTCYTPLVTSFWKCGSTY